MSGIGRREFVALLGGAGTWPLAARAQQAACRRLAEAGCSANEIMAFSGHATMKELVRYTKAADQARLARNAMIRTTIGATGWTTPTFSNAVAIHGMKPIVGPATAEPGQQARIHANGNSRTRNVQTPRL